MLNSGFSPWPYFSEEEIDAVSRVLRTGKVNYWTGEENKLFEEEFARYVGCEYSIALSNGTVALEAALLSVGVGAGDEVIVTPRTFFASASAVVSVGARPVFADVCLNSQNITHETIAPLITNKTKAIICVHLAGYPCEMDEIIHMSREHGFYVIEDCAQAHGAKYKGRSVGSIGDVAAWSFCQDKIISTGGEGGMITSNRKDIWEKVWSMKDHGKSYSEVQSSKNGKAGFKWLHNSFGTNWRMTEMQAAIGREQLKVLDDWVYKRQRNASILTTKFKDSLAIRIPKPPSHISCSFYKFYAFINIERLKPSWSRDAIISKINDAGVPCFHGSCSEVYNEKAFNNTGMQPLKPLPNAKILGYTSIMFLVHPTLQPDEMERMGSIAGQILRMSSN